MPPTSIGAELKQRLAALRRRLRFVATFRGSAWLAAVVLSVLLAGGLLDYLFHLPALIRGLILSALLTAAGVVAYRLLFRPLSEPSDDLSLALHVEERFPSLNDALASTMQFLERGEQNGPEGESASLRRETVKRAVGRATGLDFLRVVDARGVRVAGVCALFSFLPVVFCLLLAPVLSATAFARLTMPFSDVDWPRKTRIELDKDPVKRIGRNREYRLTGSVTGAIPKEATLELTHAGFPAQRRPLGLVEDETSTEPRKTFVVHLRPNEVHKDFSFRILAGDNATPRYDVEVLSLPTLAPLDGKASPQVRLDVPAYTDLPTPQNLPAGTGNIDTVVGTVVTLRAAADRPIKRAWIEYQPETAGASVSAALAGFGTTHPLLTAAGFRMGQEVYQPVRAELPTPSRRFSITFRPVAHGSYLLQFEDENELVNQRQYELRLKADPPPTVRMDRPSMTRDMLATVLATAELPLHVVAEDTQFAVRTVWLEYRVNDQPTRTRVLYDHAKGLAADAAGLMGGAILIPPTPRLRLPRLEFDRTFALRQIRHADGTPLKDGDVIVLQAFADDFDDVTPGKDPGHSPAVEIRIVSRPEFERHIDKAQAAVQQELQRLHEKQKEALKKTQEAEARLRKNEKTSPEREAMAEEEQAQKAAAEAKAEEEKAEKAENDADKRKHREKAAEARKRAEEFAKKAEEHRKQAQQLADAEELQQQIARKLGDDKEGLRAEVDRLKQAMKDNGLENTAAMDRLKAIGKELEALAEEDLPRIESKLSSAKKAEQMQDEERRKERMAELEQKAKQAEAEARADQARAKEFQQKADKLHQDAKATPDEVEAAKKEADARNFEKQAEQAKQRAREKLAELESAKKEAARTTDPNQARKDVADARRGQEEAEKRFDAMLKDLEPWSKTTEMRDEARRLAKEQKDLEAKADELENKLRGKQPEELAQEEKAELEELKNDQKRLAQRADQLIDKMERMAKDRADKDPQTAEALLEAAKQAKEGNLGQNMKDAESKIGENKLNEARKKQREALAQLEELEKNLEEDRKEELDRLKRRLKKQEDKVEELMDEQERLQKKVREAEKIADKDKREDELKKLAQKQQELKERAEKELKELSRQRNNPRAQKALEQAVQEMEQAGKQLQGGKADDEKQDDVLDRLDEARMELQKARKEAEEELAREQIARVADALRRVRDRQQALGDEGKRIQNEVLARKAWERPLQLSTLSLKDNQKGLGDETETIAKRDLTAAPVFQKLLERVARNMKRGGDRFGEIALEKPALDKLPDAEAARTQAAALRGLQQLLDSLKEQAEKPRPLAKNKDDGDGDGGDGGGAGGPMADGLPPTAQLKLLRALQLEVNEKTADFRAKHPDAAKLTDKEKAELAEIQREQKEVADLLDQLTRPPGEGDGDEADKKAEKEDKQ